MRSCVHLALLCSLFGASLAPAQESALPVVATHGNDVPAGRLERDVLTAGLEVGTGLWGPEKEAGPAHEVHAFAEAGGPLQIPGPLLRAREGTELRIAIRNRLADSLVVHGLRTRPGAAGDTIVVAPGGLREVRFQAGAPGTYFYWATTTGAASTAVRMSEESQLSGAFVIDPRGGPPADDRIFLIGVWLDPDELRAKGRFVPIARRAVVVNGLSWPHTERFHYTAGDSIRWRWINATDRAHPMHLHGAHFQIVSRGDAVRDTLYPAEEQGLVVTESVPPGGTFSLLWLPERPGNWLFHCHTLGHISPSLRLAGTASAGEGHPAANHALEGMAGLVVGIEILSPDPQEPTPTAVQRRPLRLVAAVDPGRYGRDPGFGFVLDDGSAALTRPGRPGPPLILVRGEPVAITVVNQLPEPTSVHWHGIELESFFDGVSGWSGSARKLAPSVAPGDSFIVHMAPPRAGTFIYHTHFEEERQLRSGMYGALLVLEPGAAFDPRTDRILILSSDGQGRPPTSLLNGRQAPEVELEAGTTYRLRLINIMDNGVRAVSLLAGDEPVSWRPIAKDGADLPAARQIERPARQTIGVGETYDYEFAPATPGTLRLEVRQRGDLVLAGLVQVVAPAR